VDVITLQNPHGMPTASLPSASTVAKTTQAVPKPAPAAGVAAVKAKENAPCTLAATSISRVN